MKLNFKPLEATDIECRVATVNAGGVTLLLYKDARADMNALDETVGPMNWQKSYSRDNANCTVSIWDEDKGQWVSKEDTGKESNAEAQKGLASDSFKRACFNWGIGRELYTAPNLFIGKSKLKGFSPDGAKYKCTDSFKVKSIEYAGNKIASVTISICEWGKEYDSVTFRNNVAASTPSKEAPTTAGTSKASTIPSTFATPSTSDIRDDEIILVGNCKGKKYGDVKGTEQFKKFLAWVKTVNTVFPEADRNEQFLKFKKMAEAV